MFELVPFERGLRRMAAFDPFRAFDELERSFFGNDASRAVPAFRTDVKDMGESFLLEAELPGFKKEDICVDIQNGLLSISAEHKEEKDDSSDNFVKRERYYGSFRRSFNLRGIEADGITASYNDGILSLQLPKKKELIPEKRRLEIQ